MPTTVSGFVNHGLTLTSSAEAPLTVTSSGIVDTPTYQADGVYGAAGLDLAINNSGGIFAFGQYGRGIYVAGSGTITNNTGAYIYGSSSGVYLYGGSVVNSGHIIGHAFSGVQGGSFVLLNEQSGVITGGTYGVQPGGVGCVIANAGTIFGGQTCVIVADSTVINAGTITGAAGYSVLFGSLGVGGNRLVVDPGAVFNGVAAVLSGFTGTLEFAAGTTKGQVAGIGTQFQNFGSIVIDAGAGWILNGGNTLAAGVHLGNNGSLQVGGAGVAASLLGAGTITGALVDDALVQATSGTFEITGRVTGSGSLAISPGAELRLDGGVSLSGRGLHTMSFTGAGETLGLGGLGNVGVAISGFGLGDAIDLLGHQVTGFNFLNNTLATYDGRRLVDRLHFQSGLSVSNLQFAADGHGGTEILFHATVP